MADTDEKRWGGMSGGRTQDWQRQERQGWNGQERRVGINYNYTGPERREQPSRAPRVPTGEHGQTGGMGTRPNTSDAGRFGSTQNYPEESGLRGPEQRGGLVGSERPYEDEDDDL